MNDPMEGFFRPSEILKGKSDYKEIVNAITHSKTNIGIACFTEGHEDVLMWSHYAANYTGMCLVYLTRNLMKARDMKLVRLAYVDEPPLIYPSHARDIDSAAVRILSQKKFNWAYEREWRVLGPVGKLQLGKAQAVEAIYFGSRINLRHRRQILASVRATNIKAYMMKVKDYVHSFEPVNAAAESS